MSASVTIDDKAVALLARLLTESDLTEIEYKQGETLIRVAKNTPPVTLHSGLPSAFPPFSSHGVSLPQEKSEPVPVDDSTPIKSPLVGTVYIAPEPSAPPFAQKGKTVKEGDILFIVEAMKVMNPIRAPRPGVVKEICVENGMPVEFDQVLLYLAA